MEPTNDDARVRDHLANERTYLAWMRTGIATMGFGVVIAKLRYLFPPTALTPPSRGIIHASNIGLLFTVIGLLTVMLSAWRYIVVQEQIRQQSYRTSKELVLLFSGIVILLGLLIVWYLVESTLTH
jgi:putative membrane protein